MSGPRKPGAGIIAETKSYEERLFHYANTMGEPRFMAFV